jgi:DNA-binding IclR family transcriptional regulator
MKVSISKSVGRAFEVLEIFREMRKPASATEVRRRLGCPHSSAVAILHNLVEIGYLRHDAEKRVYFPSYKLYKLGTWVPSAIIESTSLHDLATATAMETHETTAITGRSFVFLNIIHVIKGNHAFAAQFPCGLGATLFKSTPGLVVLSQMADEEVLRLVKFTNRWSQKTKADFLCDADEAIANVEKIRKDGFAEGYDWSLPGVGAIAYPLPSPFDGTPLAISVTGPTARIRNESALIHRVIGTYLEMHNHGVRDLPKGWAQHLSADFTPRIGRTTRRQFGSVDRPERTVIAR